MVWRNALATAALVASSAAQVVQYSSGQYGISVNVPANTASSGSGSIFLQISAPSGTEWVGFGQGSKMQGSNMLIVYAADSTNVTVSPRLGTGHVEPDFNSAASVSVLDGSGVTSDGTLVANIRCDSCLSWSGGSMSPTDSSSSWIIAYKSGDALDSTDQSAQISQHDSQGTFSLDLTSGTGGSSSNPFVAAAVSSSSAAASSAGTSSASATAAPTQSQGGSQTTAPTTATETSTATTSTVASATGPVSNPLVSSNPSSSSGTISKSPSKSVRTAHATLMSLVFIILFPLSALTLYLPYNNKVRHVHAPLQVLTIIFMLVGLGFAVKLGNQVDKLDGYHMVIGYLIVAWMVLFQPLLGLLQHLHFRKAGNRSVYGHGHRWFGRAVILLGIVNGGLGFKITGAVGSDNVPTYAVVVYSVFAVLIFVIYIAVMMWPKSTSGEGSAGSLPGEKSRPRTGAYEMQGRRTERERRRSDSRRNDGRRV